MSAPIMIIFINGVGSCPNEGKRVTPSEENTFPVIKIVTYLRNGEFMSEIFLSSLGMLGGREGK